MNKSVVLAMIFLTAGILFTAATITTAPAAYAGGDGYKEDKKKYKDGYDNSNKNYAGDESAASIADCDKNYVEHAGFKCIPIAIGEVEVVEPEPEPGILTVCKDIIGGIGDSAQFTVTGNNPSPSEFALRDFDCQDVTIGPGEFEVVEEPPQGTELISIRGPCELVSPTEATGEIQSGETQTCTFFNSD